MDGDIIIPFRRPRTPFWIFMSHRRRQVKMEHPGLSGAKISKILGRMWRKLTPAEKKEYRLMWLDERRTYNEQAIEYCNEIRVAPVRARLQELLGDDSPCED